MPALIERPKMTKAMYQALKKHIMREREKKKQEQEQDAELERIRKEKELKKKKEKEDSLTLEQTKEQISTLEGQLESLKQEKHELFSQLKKVLHEDETRRRTQQMKEQSEQMIAMGQHYPHGIPVNNQHPMTFMQGGHMTGRPTMYKPQQTTMMPGMKRPRSPSPPPVSIYQPTYEHHRKFDALNYAHPKPIHGPYAATQKPNPYHPAQQSHIPYGTHTSQAYQQQPQQTTAFTSNQSTSKYAPSQSAFTSYPSHYAHQQKSITDHFGTSHPGYQVQRMQQPGYNMNSPRGPLQQQVDSSGQKSPKDQFKHQGPLKGVTPLTQHQSVIQQQIQIPPQQAPPNRGSIVTGYPVRTQAVTSTYQPPSSTQTAPSRHNFPGQQPGGRYY